MKAERLPCRIASAAKRPTVARWLVTLVRRRLLEARWRTRSSASSC